MTMKTALNCSYSPPWSLVRGGCSGHVRTSIEPPQRPLPFYRFDSVQRASEIPKSRLSYRDSKGPIRRRLPLDRLGSGVCHSPSTDLTRDSWNFSFVSPIAGEGGGRNRYQMGIRMKHEQSWQRPKGC